MNLADQFKGVVSPESIKYVYARLTAVVGDFLEAGKAVDVAYGDKSNLVAKRVQLDTEIKLDESEAFMTIQGEGKSAFVEINGQKVGLSNEQARDAYRRTVTKVKRTELAQIAKEIAKIDVEIARAKDKYKTASDAADSLKAVAAVQAALLVTISRVAT